MDHVPTDLAGEMSLSLRGSVDRCAADGTVFGWAWSPLEPRARRRVLVFANGEQIAETIADRPRGDLAAAAIGDGAHAFQCLLPDSAFAAGAIAVVQARDGETGARIGTDLVVDRASLDQRAAPPLNGSLDQITPEGWVTGWCWYPDLPNHRVELAILVDGAEVGVTIAANHRADLEQHGIGDGAHGFSFALPWPVLADRGEMTIAVVDLPHRTPLAAPATLRIGANAATEARIQDLERQVSVLRSEIAGARRAAVTDESRAARDLFRTVAAFFQELADAPPEDGFAGAGLRAALAAFAERFAPLALRVPVSPDATLFLDTRAPVDLIYLCLAAIRATGADLRAEVILLDDGSQGGEAALLPTVVRNLRYQRIPPATTLAAARNAAARDARGEFLVFLASDTVPAQGWLDTLLATLACEPDSALVGARVLRDDGLLDHAGFLIDADLRVTAPGRGEDPDRPEWSFLRPVDAVADRGFAVRAAMFRAIGGFADTLDTAATAVIDCCLRLRADGRSVLHQPDAVLTRAGPMADEPIIGVEGQRRLRLRWRGAAPPPHGFAGHALFVDRALPRPHRDAGSIPLIEHARVLRGLGWRVTFVAADDADTADADPDAVALLQRHGIEVARPPATQSATALLQSHGPTIGLVVLHRLDTVAPLIERARALAPQARVIFSPGELGFLRERRAAAGTARPAPREAARARVLAGIAAADATLVTSDHALRRLAEAAGPDKLTLLRWITEARSDRPAPDARHDIGFVGDFRHAENVDGVLWFVEHVVPQLRRSHPDLVVHLIGADPSPAILGLEEPRVVVHGWVRHLTPLLDRLRLTVAPLRSGAGFPGKIATSLANGVPVVGTAVAAEGTGLADGDGIAVADTAADFARAINDLLTDDALWTGQSARGLARCRALYAPTAARAVWRDLLTRMSPPLRAP